MKHDFDEILILRKHDSEGRIIFESRFLKSFAQKKSHFHSIYPVKCANFAFYVQFEKRNFEEK